MRERGKLPPVGLSHIGWVFYPSSNVHTGGPRSKASPIRCHVKATGAMCCFYSVHRVSADDEACLYGTAYVAFCVSPPEILEMRHCHIHAVLCNLRKASLSCVDCLRAMAQSFSVESRLGQPIRSTTGSHHPMLGHVSKQRLHGGSYNI